MAPKTAAVVGGFGLLALTALGGAVESRQVAVQLFQFRPGVIDVPVGTRVTWINRDEIDHTVTAGTPDRPTGRFDFTLDGQGTTASVEFGQPGSYPYFCNRHHHMRGEIRVREEEGTHEDHVRSDGGRGDARRDPGSGRSQTMTDSSGGSGMSGSMASATMPASASKAAWLRSTLNTLFQEHVYLAAAATGAALAGRESEFKAAAHALDDNSPAIAKAVGSVYGDDAEKAFLPLWRRHIGFAVDYTVGVATSDKMKQDKAVNDLVGYAQDLSAFLSGPTRICRRQRRSSW